VVTLNGTVGNQAAKVLATTEIQDVEGIKSVMNNLNVVGGTPKPVRPTPSGDVQNKNVILPFGSILPVHVSAEIGSKTAHVNDTFHATVATNVIANGYMLVPAGAPVEGTVLEAKPRRTFRQTRCPLDCADTYDFERSRRAARRRVYGAAAFEQSAGCNQRRANRRGIECTLQDR